MTADFHQFRFDCGCELNIKRDNTVLSYYLCDKHRKQKKDAD